MLIWIGKEKGIEGLPGVPARDLSDEEVKTYGGEAWLIKTGLWQKPREKKAKNSSPSSD